MTESTMMKELMLCDLYAVHEAAHAVFMVCSGFEFDWVQIRGEKLDGLNTASYVAGKQEITTQQERCFAALSLLAPRVVTDRYLKEIGFDALGSWVIVTHKEYEPALHVVPVNFHQLLEDEYSHDEQQVRGLFPYSNDESYAKCRAALLKEIDETLFDEPQAYTAIHKVAAELVSAGKLDYKRVCQILEDLGLVGPTHGANELSTR